MGLYIAQQDLGEQTLLEWLKENGHPVMPDTVAYNFTFDNDDLLAVVPVCWIVNLGFNAAGIAFDYQELARFLGGTAGREHEWFLVPKDLLTRWLPAGYQRNTKEE